MGFTEIPRNRTNEKCKSIVHLTIPDKNGTYQETTEN